jgi:hypothetical protein
MGVQEIGKYPGQECLHQIGGGGGCSIYTTRPESCQKFMCLWLQSDPQGILSERDRPEKCGVILLASGDHSAFTKGTGIPITICHEVSPGAFHRYHGERLINKLKKKLVLVMVPYGGLTDGARRLLIGPPLLVRKAHEWLTSQGKLK